MTWWWWWWWWWWWYIYHNTLIAEPPSLHSHKLKLLIVGCTKRWHDLTSRLSVASVSRLYLVCFLCAGLLFPSLFRSPVVKFHSPRVPSPVAAVSSRCIISVHYYASFLHIFLFPSLTSFFTVFFDISPFQSFSFNFVCALHAWLLPLVTYSFFFFSIFLFFLLFFVSLSLLPSCVFFMTPDVPLRL